MQMILIYILILLITAGILIWYLNYEKRKQNQNTEYNQPLQRILDKNQLDNATYIECHYAQEANREDMLNEIIHQWKITNFWLGCIGIVFLFILVVIVTSIILGIQVGKEVNDMFRTISF